MTYSGAVLVLLSGVAVIGSNSLLLGPVAPGIARGWLVPVGAVLLASSAYGIGTGTGALFLARWIDRLGLRQVLSFSLMALAVSFVTSAIAAGPVTLSAAQFLAGLAAGVALPAIYAGAARIAQPGRETSTLGWVLTGWTLSLVLGVSLSAVLADWVHWRVIYAGLALITLLLALQVDRLPVTESIAPAAPSPLAALQLPGVLPLLAIVVTYMAAFYGVYAYVGEHLVDGLNLPLAYTGWISLLYGAGFGAAVLMDRVMMHIGRRRVVTYGMFLLASTYCLLGLRTADFYIILSLCAIWGLLNHLVLNALITQLSSVSADQRGTILGLYSCTTYFTMALAIGGYGLLYPEGGWLALTRVSAALCVAGVLLAWRGAKSGFL